MVHEDNAAGINLENHVIQDVDKVTQEHVCADDDELNPVVVKIAQ